MLLYACTSNQGKLREFLLAGAQSGLPALQISPLPNLQTISPPEETGETFEENAALKALYYSRFADAPVFADDSGLEVDSIGGEPGVYSARYAGPGSSDEENNRHLLKRLETVMNRHGRFVCAIALAHSGRLITTVRGSVEGEILEELRGAGGFGYDPLFFYPPLNQSFGELSPEEKFQHSHRGNALRSLFAYLRTSDTFAR